MRAFFILLLLISTPFAFGQISQLKKDISVLANDSLEGRLTGTKGERMAANYIAKRFQEIGLEKMSDDEETYFQIFSKKTRSHPHDNAFTGPVIEGRNVIGFIDKKKEKTIVIGAHYDHLGWGASGSLHTGEKAIHNGADDNASGVAAILEIAQRLKNKPMNHNILFLAFSGEEMGLLGSNYFVDHPSFQSFDVDLMINLDMVGRLNQEKKLAINGVGSSPQFIPALTKQNTDFHFVFDSTGIGPSDHTSFYLDSIPAIHLFTGQHEDYHRPSDDVEKINFQGLDQICDFVERVVLDIDQLKEIVFHKTKEPEQKRYAFKVTLGIIPDYLYDGKGLKIDGVKEQKTADLAGIKKDDIILKMGEHEILSIYDYMKVLKTLDEGDKMKVLIQREGSNLEKTVLFK